MRMKRRVGLLMLVALLLTGVANAQEGGQPQTGTDPRDFANKFMPYFRYTELDNGLVQNYVANRPVVSDDLQPGQYVQ